jgi:hypothetical protein
MIYTSEEKKLIEGRGKGIGADYKPWIKIQEVKSQGTACTVTDYKHGREIHLLSQGEMYYYYLLRWDDNVMDIRERYPLNLIETKKICDSLRWRHPFNETTHMTTDFLITHADGSFVAYGVQSDREELENPRIVEKLYVEKLYWQRRGIAFKLLFKSDVNRIRVRNIIDVVSCYDPRNIQDAFGAIRHKIAHKEILVDMDRQIEYPVLMQILQENNNS